MLFTNPDNTDVFTTFVWKAFVGSFSLPDLMGSQLAGIHTILDAFKVFPTTNYYSTGTATCQPTRALWQTTTYYYCYHATAMGTNTYAVMRWPLVDPTYGTIGDYVYTSVDYIYDIFYMYTATNQYYVYLVQKRTTGFTPSIISSVIQSYHSFGYLRMKHHIVNNNYYLYLMGRPWTTVYTCSVDPTWVTTYRATNNYAFGQISMNSIDIQAKYSGAFGWQFYSINAGNVMTPYLFNQYDPS